MILLLILNSTFLVFADSNDNNEIEFGSKEWKEKAKNENKVIGEKKYEKLVEKYYNNPDKLIKELEKYAVTSEIIYQEKNNVGVNSILRYEPTFGDEYGDKRIRTVTLFIYDNKTDSTYSVSQGGNIDYGSYLGFLSFLPAPYGTGFGVVSIFQSLVSGITVATTASIYEKSSYDKMIIKKYSEVYMGDGWETVAVTEQARYDGIYFTSGYEYGTNHFARTRAMGMLRRDTGKYFYDEAKLLSYAIPYHGPTIIWDYLSDYSDFWYPNL